MKIKLSQEIKTLTGDSYKTESGPLTLGVVIAEALTTDQTLGKMKAFALAQKAYSGKEMEVDAADLVVIKKAVEQCKSYNGNPIILGQALTLLEEAK